MHIAPNRSYPLLTEGLAFSSMANHLKIGQRRRTRRSARSDKGGNHGQVEEAHCDAQKELFET